MMSAGHLRLEYQRKGRVKRCTIALCCFVLAMVGVTALAFGPYRIPFASVLRSLWAVSPSPAWVVFWKIRLPRTTAALAVGSGLGLSGLFIQGLLRNPLGSPSTIGISQGAAFGAAVAIIALDARVA